MQFNSRCVLGGIGLLAWLLLSPRLGHTESVPLADFRPVWKPTRAAPEDSMVRSPLAVGWHHEWGNASTVTPMSGSWEVDPNLPEYPQSTVPYWQAGPTLFQDPGTRLQQLFQMAVEDQRSFYSCENLSAVGVGLGVGAILANTSLDEDFRDWFQDNVHRQHEGETTWHKWLGDGDYILPIVAATWFISEAVAPDCGDGQDYRREINRCTNLWAERTVRSWIVGVLPALGIQYATGGSRPGESSAGSSWKPFQDSNGLSGHAFVGAVPWIAAAKMTPYPLLKIGLYTLSALPGYSRVYDDRHYLSQVLLGWWIAYLSVTSIEQTDFRHFQVVPVSSRGFHGAAAMFRW